MKKIRNIGADFTLTQTEEACEQIQRGGFQLETISTTTIEENGKSVPKNKAVFNNVLDNIPNELTFIDAATTSKEDLKKLEKDGHKAICDGEIYVQNKVTKVMVFGKTV